VFTLSWATSAGGQTGLGLLVVLLERAGREVGAPVGAMAGHRGIELQVLAGRDPGQAGDLVRLTQQAAPVAVRVARGDPVPHVARVGAEDVEAPCECAVRPREAELVEGDRELDHVAVARDLARALPDRVPGPVLDAVQLAEDRVGLHAQRVDPELEGAALVVERVELEAHVVVLLEGRDRVPVREVGSDLRRVGVVGVERDVEARLVKGDEAFGPHGRRRVVAGEVLVGQLDDRGVRPCFVVEHAVDPDGGRGVVDFEGPSRGDLARRLRLGGARRLGWSLGPQGKGRQQDGQQNGRVRYLPGDARGAGRCHGRIVRSRARKVLKPGLRKA
jgi:hypothetical protein